MIRNKALPNNNRYQQNKMGCFGSKTPKNNTANIPISKSNQHFQDVSRNIKHEFLLRIQNCKVHLIGEGEAIHLTTGDFDLIKLSDDNIPLATIVKVGNDLQWPLTKDEPVVKLGAYSYLFSLPMKGESPLSYGLTFSETCGREMALLDSLLKEYSCFSNTESRNRGVNWKEFAPKIEDYNNLLAKAIAGGTGQIVKGIFKCSNAYTNQVQRGGEIILTQTQSYDNNGIPRRASDGNKEADITKQNQVNKSLKRVRELSKMTEKLSKKLLDGIELLTGSVMTPLVNTQSGKAFLAMVPGQVLLASLDAVNKILDAVEVAEKQALSATSNAVTKRVSQRYGESAAEGTGDVLATAGHLTNTAWNVIKIRKSINPSSTISSGVRNAAKSFNKY